MHLFHLFALAVSCIVSIEARSLSFAMPAGNHFSTGALRYSLGLAISEIEYDSGRSDPDSERTIFGGAVSHGFGSSLAVFAQLGMIVDSEIDSGPYDYEGSGLLVGGGVQGRFEVGSASQVVPYLMMNIWSEDLEEKIGIARIEAEVSITDVHIGAIFAHAVNNKFRPYAGADIIISSKGEFEATVTSGTLAVNADADFDRDEKFSLRLGALIDLNGFTLRAETILAGEQTFIVGGGGAF